MKRWTITLALIAVGITILLSLTDGGRPAEESKPAPIALPHSGEASGASPDDRPMPASPQEEVSNRAEEAVERSDEEADYEEFSEESVYDVVFGQRSYGLGAVYATFLAEARDESWAGAMESGISQSINASGGIAGAAVERIECRTTICVVLGFMPDAIGNPEPDLQSMLGRSFGDGWWQGSVDVVTRKHTFEDEGITRFVLLIASRERLSQVSGSPN